MRLLILCLFLLIFIPFIVNAQKPAAKDAPFSIQKGWWNADRSSAGIAPLPEKEKQAVVQIYYARAYGWRRYFGVHSWISTKEKDASSYTVYQVMGWRQWRGLPVVSVEKDLPDRHWFDEKPILLYSTVGEKAKKMIPYIEKAAKSYPYPNTYILWPGPNSNSFISHLIRHTPGIRIELPPSAIGKDWIDDGKFFARSESKTGYQFSFFGLLGLTIGKAEGLEINILGLTFGIDLLNPALKLPFIGRIGLQDKPV